MALLFFDVDGTLWDFNEVIPESTKTAIRLLKENGHQPFICSGRAKVFLRSEKLLSLGFDGFSGGCGTEIEYRGEELFYRTMDHDLLMRAIQICEEADMPVMLESRDVLFLEKDEFGRDEFSRQLIESMRDVIRPIQGNEESLEGTKLTALVKGKDYREIGKELENDFKIMVHGDYVMEAVPTGCSKATSIAFLCDFLEADRADTYAFGDGVNDLEMLDYAGYGIVMGNGVAVAKEHAGYITDDIHEDGIFNACRHFGLI